MERSCDLGLIGLAVMGQNLVLNFESRGYSVAVFNRTVDKVERFVAERAAGKRIVGCSSLEDLVASLARPRKIMMKGKAGSAVDDLIERLLPLLDEGDILIDGGNTHFSDTERRTKYVESRGMLYIGTGVSGGEEGALKGPSLMPGGSPSAWPVVRDMFRSIAAKAGPGGDEPCCEWFGAGGAGHYVKMVHNGIEYGDMQLICEAYHLMQEGMDAEAEELYDVFDAWNRGPLQSYLIEITRDVFSVPDERAGQGWLVDSILDVAGAKGTGKWMSQHALDLGVPSTLVTTAVFARGMSAMKAERVRASEVLHGPGSDARQAALEGLGRDRAERIERIAAALYASKISSYAQGFVQLRTASQEHGWDIDLGKCAAVWRGGCIIRAQFLDRITEAFAQNVQLENLLLAPYFREATESRQAAWRAVTVTAALMGIPVPAFSAALAYYDSLRHARLPANLLQAQRDYFGAHTYRRVDQEGSFHTDWLGKRRPPRPAGDNAGTKNDASSTDGSTSEGGR